MLPLECRMIETPEGVYIEVAMRQPGWRERLRTLLMLPLVVMGVLAAGSFHYSRVAGGYALDIVTGRAAGPGARTTYLALLTAAASDSSTIAGLSELSTSGYARQTCAFSAPTVATPPSSSNSGTITFGPFTADPPNVTSWALVSSSSGTAGDFLAYGDWGTARDVGIGDSLQVAVGGLAGTCE